MSDKKKKNPLKANAVWYATLPEPYNTQARDNAVKEGSILEQNGSLFEAVINGFGFVNTPQGLDYWLELTDTL